MAKLWFSIFDRSQNYREFPFFEDTSRYELASVLESNYETIKQELLNYIGNNQLQSYFNTTMVETKSSWKTISLNSWDVNVYENFAHFPKTLSLIKSIPHVVSSSFSMLEPNSKIVPHCGDTNGIFRCHLGLSIPSGLPACGFRVGDEWRNWDEGKLLMFIDANNHEAVNLTDTSRFIMIVDVIRPEFQHRRQWICATVLTSIFLQRLAEKSPLLYKTPLSIQSIIARILVPFAYVAIPVRNFLYKK